MKIVTAFLLLCSATIPAAATENSDKRSFLESKCSFTVSNPSDSPRREVMETPFNPSETFILSDETGKEIECQITHDGKLIFMADVPAYGQRTYTLAPGKPQPVDTVCYGRVFPERKDDMAWENDRSAYRAYGPALQASGERAYGYDIWTKSVAHPVLEKRFYDDRVNHISFHEDHGEGMDVYGVGPTLGGGTSAILLAGDRIVYPWCWETAEILDNGPLRFTARLTYPPAEVDGRTVRETRLITLDAGSWLNRTEVCFDGLEDDMRPIAGIVVHEASPEGYTLMDNAATYVDLTQDPANGNGEIYVAVLSVDDVTPGYIPLPSKTGDAVGHVCIIGEPGKKDFSYYWGSGWQKGGVADADDWKSKVERFEKNLKNPLKIQINN